MVVPGNFCIFVHSIDKERHTQEKNKANRKTEKKIDWAIETHRILTWVLVQQIVVGRHVFLLHKYISIH